MNKLLVILGESDRTKAIISIVLSGLSLILFLVVLHLNYSKQIASLFFAGF